MGLVYNAGIVLYNALAILISPFNDKARQWVEGRRDWYPKLQKGVDRGARNIWIHAASLGEFEQGRPVIEKIRSEMPDHRIILTFFSPSGYEIRKDYRGADYVSYLPPDTSNNAKRFVEAVNPVCVIFIKYEFWNNYITQVSRRNIPLYLISAIFRPGQPFFKWYGGFFRGILSRFTHIFVQDGPSAELLKGLEMTNVTIAGDTRFDRVAALAGSAGEIKEIELFRGKEKLFLAGSSWKPDEEIIADYINANPDRMKWLFAPHETDRPNIDRLVKLFRTKVVRLSEFSESDADARVMIIDSIGLLGPAYRYAYVAEVGGGFGKGIHNILEAACWGIPVMFGPNYKKFREAVDLINQNGAKTFKSSEEFSSLLERWLSDDAFYLKSAKTASLYVSKNTGATSIILSVIKEKDINF